MSSSSASLSTNSSAVASRRQSPTAYHQLNASSNVYQNQTSNSPLQSSEHPRSRLPSDIPTFPSPGPSHVADPQPDNNVYSMLWMTSSSASASRDNFSATVNQSSSQSTTWSQQQANKRTRASGPKPAPPPRQDRDHAPAASSSSSISFSPHQHPLTSHLWQIATSIELLEDPASHQLMLEILHVPLITPSSIGNNFSTQFLEHLHRLDCASKLALRHAVEETFSRYIEREIAARDPRHSEIHKLLQRLRLFTLQCNQRVYGVPPATMLSQSIAGTQVDPVMAILSIMKLSFDENHRVVVVWLGGLETLSEVLLSEHRVTERCPERLVFPPSLLLRRYLCVCLTNLTFHLGENKSSLCSREACLEALTKQLDATCDELVQAAASVLRNLSWRANEGSRLALQRVECARRLMLAALRYAGGASLQDVGEHTLKSVLSALWNLSAHSTANKLQIAQVRGAVEFLVSILSYSGLHHSLAIVESGGGILRNIAPLLVANPTSRELLSTLQCVEVLLRQLQSSPSLTVVSNAVGTLLALVSPLEESGTTTCGSLDRDSSKNIVSSPGLRPSEWSSLQRLCGVGMLHSLMQSKHRLISQTASQVVWHLAALDPHLYAHQHRRSCPAQWMSVNGNSSGNGESGSTLSRSVPPGILEGGPATTGSLLSQRQQKQWKTEQEELLLHAASSVMSRPTQPEEDEYENTSVEDRGVNEVTSSTAAATGTRPPRQQHIYVNVPFSHTGKHDLQPPCTTFLPVTLEESVQQRRDSGHSTQRLDHCQPSIMGHDLLSRITNSAQENPRVWAVEGSSLPGGSASSDEEDSRGSPLSSISEVTEEEDDEENEGIASHPGSSAMEHGRGLMPYSSGALSPVMETSMEHRTESEHGEDGFTCLTTPHLPQSGRHSSSIRSLLSCAGEHNTEAPPPDSASQLSRVPSTPSLDDLPDSPCQEDAVEILLAHEARHQREAESIIEKCIHSALPQSTETAHDVGSPVLWLLHNPARQTSQSQSSAEESSDEEDNAEVLQQCIHSALPQQQQLVNEDAHQDTPPSSQSHTNTSDSVRHFAMEGTPLQHCSHTSSLSELSLPDLIPHPAHQPWNAALNKLTSRTGPDASVHHSASSTDDEQSSQLLSQVIQSAMPTNRGTSLKPNSAEHTKTTANSLESSSWPQPFKSKLPQVKLAAVNVGTSSESSCASSKSKCTNAVQSQQNKENVGLRHSSFLSTPAWNSMAGAKQTTTPDNMSCTSSTPSSRITASYSNSNHTHTGSSLSSLSLESSGIENSLLLECISSAMPLPKMSAPVASKVMTPSKTAGSSSNSCSSRGSTEVSVKSEEVSPCPQASTAALSHALNNESHFLSDGSGVTASGPLTRHYPMSIIAPPSHPEANQSQLCGQELTLTSVTSECHEMLSSLAMSELSASARWLKSNTRRSLMEESTSRDSSSVALLESSHFSSRTMTLSVMASSSLLSLEVSDSELEALVDPLEIDASPRYESEGTTQPTDVTPVTLTPAAVPVTAHTKEARKPPTGIPTPVSIKSRLPQMRPTRPTKCDVLKTSTTMISPTRGNSLPSVVDTRSSNSSLSSTRQPSPAANSSGLRGKGSACSMSPARSPRYQKNSTARSSTVEPVISPAKVTTTKVFSATKPTSSSLVKTPTKTTPKLISPVKPISATRASPITPVRARSAPVSSRTNPGSLASNTNAYVVKQPLKPITTTVVTSPTSESDSAEKLRSIRGGRRALTGIRLPSASSSTTSGQCVPATRTTAPSIRVNKVSPTDDVDSMTSEEPATPTPSVTTMSPSVLTTRKRLVATVSPSRQVKPALSPVSPLPPVASPVACGSNETSSQDEQQLIWIHRTEVAPQTVLARLRRITNAEEEMSKRSLPLTMKVSPIVHPHSETTELHENGGSGMNSTEVSKPWMTIPTNSTTGQPVVSSS